jgi:hypothetical protein
MTLCILKATISTSIEWDIPMLVSTRTAVSRKNTIVIANGGTPARAPFTMTVNANPWRNYHVEEETQHLDGLIR